MRVSKVSDSNALPRDPSLAATVRRLAEQSKLPDSAAVEFLTHHNPRDMHSATLLGAAIQMADLMSYGARNAEIDLLAARRFIRQINVAIDLLSPVVFWNWDRVRGGLNDVAIQNRYHDLLSVFEEKDLRDLFQEFKEMILRRRSEDLSNASFGMH